MVTSQCGVAVTVPACISLSEYSVLCSSLSAFVRMLLLIYFVVDKTGAVLRSDNFAECKIVTAIQLQHSHYRCHCFQLFASVALNHVAPTSAAVVIFQTSLWLFRFIWTTPGVVHDVFISNSSLISLLLLCLFAALRALRFYCLATVVYYSAALSSNLLLN